MGEISAASTEQSTGVGQIGDAIAQMDQATQQNAALVEESAAAAESLRDQAHQLVDAVAVFKLEGSPRATSARRPRRSRRRGRSPGRRRARRQAGGARPQARAGGRDGRGGRPRPAMALGGGRATTGNRSEACG